MNSPAVTLKLAANRAAGPEMDRLLDVMARLRDPDGGCPWDVEQTFETISAYTIEEAYEVAEAIAQGDISELRKELGDLLFQVVFYAQMAREQGDFDFTDITKSVSDKMIERHPHVFADVTVDGTQAQSVAWETQKANERAARAKAEGRTPSVLDDVTPGFPALMRAQKLQKRAARVGFDWPDIEGAMAKIAEETEELKQELAEEGGDETRIEAEIGDLLFSLVNLSRWAGADAETALRGANRRFESRFRHIENSLAAEDRMTTDATLEELENLWQAAKQAE
jgi:ATP diphosphatase